MRARWIVVTLVACAGASGCGRRDAEAVAPEEAGAIAAEIERAMREATDLSRPDVSGRLLSLYPDRGRVVSAAGGRVIGSRDSLEAGIRYFWDNVGVNMQGAVWIWDEFLVDVLAPEVAAVTARYHVPHQTPRGQGHVIGGAWTAVFRREGPRGRWVIVQEHLSDLPREAADSIHAHMSHPPPP